MSHQEGTTKNAVLHKKAKMELSAFAPELFNCLQTPQMLKKSI